MTEWFRRLADVPGVGYTVDARVKRSTLAGHDAVPKLSNYVFEGKRLESLMWSTANGETSQSPASLHASGLSQPRTAQSTGALLQRLCEVLALPGTTSDYHFAIQSCIGELWKRRYQEPEQLSEIERLCWLDIRLIEARPEAITFERGGESHFFSVAAFGYLIDLYRNEGFLHEALNVAERGVRLNQKTPVAELRERLARLNAEEP
jgi:hypothetical protein